MMNMPASPTTAQRSWWVLALRGVLAILFGVVLVFWPGPALFVMMLFIGAYAFVDGIVAVFVSIQDRRFYPRWWLLLLEGIAGILFGLAMFIWPLTAASVTAILLLYLAAFWLILSGIAEIAAAIALRHEITHEWTLIVAGIVSIILGLLLIFNPRASLLTIILLVGIYAIIFGIVMIVRAFQYRTHAPRPAY